ncbi:MAG: dihydroorotase [Firmicutes bacterium]|nr:dihydroorotase [Bacillota bacterium]
MELVLKNGKIVDGGTIREADVWIRDGKIAEIGTDLVRPGKTLDMGGKLILPGLLDMHVHLREPGQEGKETIASGTAAAAKGGFTTVCAMPNTDPVVDNPLLVELIATRAKNEGLVRVLPVGAITKGQQGKEIAELGLMHQAGAIGFSDDGGWVQDSGVSYNAMCYAAQWDLLIISHPEDVSLVAGGVMNAGPLADKLGLAGADPVAEVAAVERDIALAEASNCRLHLTHLSVRGAVEAVRRAKARGVRVTADVTPHHLMLTETACDNYNTLARVNPPLRTEADREALLAGLLDGTIDAIATDHAPHKQTEKFTTFDDSPPGIVGLETAWGLLYAQLVESGRMSLATLVEKFTAGPRRVLGLENLSIAVGQSADITAIDPAARAEVDPQTFVGKGVNTPFAGWKMSGLPAMTMVGGEIVMLNGEVGNVTVPVEARAQVG